MNSIGSILVEAVECAVCGEANDVLDVCSCSSGDTACVNIPMRPNGSTGMSRTTTTSAVLT